MVIGDWLSLRDGEGAGGEMRDDERRVRVAYELGVGE